mmetsp:Transcript_103476/g.331765  ORF Transcript_103476/g.331765 Transcript_103476/m.331765 type:complete len:233 (+) Transcript_103476:601-1299(+)
MQAGPLGGGLVAKPESFQAGNQGCCRRNRSVLFLPVNRPLPHAATPHRCAWRAPRHRRSVARRATATGSSAGAKQPALRRRGRCARLRGIRCHTAQGPAHTWPAVRKCGRAEAGGLWRCQSRKPRRRKALQGGRERHRYVLGLAFGIALLWQPRWRENVLHTALCVRHRHIAGPQLLHHLCECNERRHRLRAGGSDRRHMTQGSPPRILRACGTGGRLRTGLVDELLLHKHG